jgi:hypothetical protein
MDLMDLTDVMDWVDLMMTSIVLMGVMEGVKKDLTKDLRNVREDLMDAKLMYWEKDVISMDLKTPDASIQFRSVRSF